MIPALIAIGVLCLVNLALTLYLLMAFWQQSRVAPGAQPDGPRPWHLKAGTMLPAFTAEAASGDSRSPGDLRGSPGVIAFFSTTCAACQDEAQELAKFAASPDRSSLYVLAVVSGPHDQAVAFSREFLAQVQVIMEPPRGPVVTAFSVFTFPTLYFVDEHGIIRCSGITTRYVARVREDSGAPTAAADGGIAK
jgi:peroxiredoxin